MSSRPSPKRWTATAAFPAPSISSGVVVGSVAGDSTAATPFTPTGAPVAYQPNTAWPSAVYCNVTGEARVSTLVPAPSPRVASPRANRQAERTPNAAA